MQLIPLIPTIYQKKISKQISTHLNSVEFDCPCGSCSTTLICDDLVNNLDKIRVMTNKPIIIDSGYRCQHHQYELTKQGLQTSKGISTHTLGMAADIKVVGMLGAQIEVIARLVGFKAVGVAPTWCHVDLRTDKIRHWTY